MRLANVAKFFDRDSVYDGYTGDFLFKAQFSSYDGSAPDGSFQRRRTISVAPGTIFPERGIVQVHGDRWLLGIPSIDGFYDKPIRLTAVARQVSVLYDVLTPGQAADNVVLAPQSIFVFSDYHKDTVDTNSSSNYDPQYQVSASPFERLYSGLFLRSAKLTLHIRSTQDSTLGLTDMLADEVSYNVRDNTPWPEVWQRTCFINVAVSGPLNPVTETSSWSEIGSGLVVDRTKLFVRGTLASNENAPGDMSMLLSTASFPNVPVGSFILMGTTQEVAQAVTVELSAVTTGGIGVVAGTTQVGATKWRVVGTVPYFDANLLHLRRV